MAFDIRKISLNIKISLFFFTGILVSIFVLTPCEANLRLTNDSASSQNPSLETDANGNSYIVWQDNRDGNWEIYFSKVDSSGNKLVQDTRITNTSGSSADPDISIDSSGNSYIVWEESNKVYFCKLDQNGNKTVSDILISTGATGDNPNPVISTSSDGTSHIAWEKRYITTYRVYYCRLNNNGAKIVSDVVVSDRDIFGGYEKQPSIYLNYIAWRDYENFSYGIYFGQVIDSNTKASMRVYQSSNARNPSLNIVNELIFLVYKDSRGSGYETYYWMDVNDDYQLSESPGSSDNPVMVTGNNLNSFIFWEDDRDGNSEIYMAHVDSNWQKAGSDERITNDSNSSLKPDASLDDNSDWYLVWQDNRDGNWEIYFSRKDLVLNNKQTSTGFFYPTGTSQFSNTCGTWLGRDAVNGGCYLDGYYHIGFDIMADENSPVVAIANGVITHKSLNGWGSGNVGIVVRHRLSDGSEFLALYGHVKTDKDVGDEVIGGVEFAKIGYWNDGNHLHFGIHPGLTMPSTNWGLMPDSIWPDTNGFVDPVNWIETESPSGIIKLPKTGQTTCYGNTAGYPEIPCTGTGQDGETQSGVVWPNPRFTLDGECVIDNLTGLMWAKDANLPNGRKTWQGSLDYAASINNGAGLCGYTDWRLPNVHELTSQINANEVDSAIWLNRQGFVNVQSDEYWTSTTFESTFGNGDARYIHMGNGDIRDFTKLHSRYVWLTRAGQVGNIDLTYPANIWRTGQQKCYDELGTEINCTGTGQDGEIQAGVAWPNARFIDNSDETVTDNLTGLMWTKEANNPGPIECQPSGLKTWQAALDTINCLNYYQFLNFSDWRLPNVKELQSLLDYSQFSPTISFDHPFSNLTIGKYWTSTTKVSDISSSAYFVYMRNGGQLLTSKSYTSGTFWPVRGGRTVFDADGDGIPDISDECPETPTSASANLEGCAAGQEEDITEWQTPSLPLTAVRTEFGTLTVHPIGSTFNPDQPTFIISHGWNSDYKIDPPQWMNDMAYAILDRVPEANILLWNWMAEAIGELDIIIGNLIPPAWKIKDSGKNLALGMVELMSSSYGGDIHLIGFSLGSGVIIKASEYLYESNNFKDNIRQLTLLDHPFYLYAPSTLNFIEDLKLKGVFIDNYWSLFGNPCASDAKTNVNLVSSGLSVDTCSILDYNPHGYANKWYISSIDNFSIPNDLCDDTAPSYDVPYGFYWWNNKTDVSSYYIHNPLGENWQLVTQELNMCILGEIVDTYEELKNWFVEKIEESREYAVKTGTKIIILSAKTFDTVEDAAEFVVDKAGHAFWVIGENIFGALKLKLNSDVTATAAMDIPANANSMRFSYDFLSSDAGGVLEVFVEDLRVFVSYIEDYSGKGWQNSEWIDISPFAGQTVNLSFRLSNPDDTKQGTILLDDILIAQIMPSVDTDEDGFIDGEDNCPDDYNPLQEDANENGIGNICERWKGDINEDGVVDISDVILVLRMALGLDTPHTCADVDGNAVVDISDVILTLRMALELDPLKQCNVGI